jgi:hypothetical protein
MAKKNAPKKATAPKKARAPKKATTKKDSTKVAEAPKSRTKQRKYILSDVIQPKNSNFAYFLTENGGNELIDMRSIPKGAEIIHPFHD